MSTYNAPARLYHLEGELDAGSGLSWPSIRRRWPLIVGLAVLGAVTFALITKPSFSATLPLQLPEDQPDLETVGIKFSTLTGTATPEAIKSYLESDAVSDDLESKYGPVELDVTIESTTTNSFAIATVSSSSESSTVDAADYVSELFRAFVIDEVTTAAVRYQSTLDVRRSTVEERVAVLESQLASAEPDGALAQALALDRSDANTQLSDFRSQEVVLANFASTPMALPVNLRVEKGSSRMVVAFAGALLGALVGTAVAFLLAITRRQIVRRRDIEAVTPVLGIAQLGKPTQVAELMRHLSYAPMDGTVALVPVDGVSKPEAMALASVLAEQDRSANVVVPSGSADEYSQLRDAGKVIMVARLARSRMADVRRVETLLRDLGTSPIGIVLIARTTQDYADAA